jgi:hypothetical protein
MKRKITKDWESLVESSMGFLAENAHKVILIFIAVESYFEI